MTVESATYISGLNATLPTGADAKAEGDDHIRLLKSTILASFPGITGAMTGTHTQLNKLVTTFSIASAPSGALAIDASGNVSAGVGATFSAGAVLAGTAVQLGGVTAGLVARQGSNGYGSTVVVEGSAGVAVLYQTIATGGVGSISLSSTTTSYNTTSDQRLKTPVATPTESRIPGVVVRDFTWNRNGEPARGVFAQELAKVIPEAVYIGGDELDESGRPIRAWAVDYSKIVPDLIIEVQSLRARLASAGIE